MTRICSVCRTVIGEKCARCGTEAQPVNVNAASAGTDFLCPHCGRRFAEGDGGETGALCTACLQPERRKAAGQ